MKKPLLIVFFMLFLAGCMPIITAGTVTEKRHEPEYKYVQFMPIKYGKVTYLIPYWITDDEDWIITIVDGDKKETLYIEESDWNQIKVGDYVDMTEDYESSDPTTKEKKTD